MRKLLILVILAALLCSISIPASAASDTYELDEVGLTVSIPADYWVITRDTPENSSVFSELGLTKAEMMTFFEEDCIYLDALSAAIDEEIVITMVPNDVKNMSDYSDSMLQQMVKIVEDSFLAIGRVVSQYEIYQNGSVKYIKVYYTETATNMHSLQYYTIYDNKAINITMHSYKGSLTAQQEATIKNIVDSAQFQKTSSGTVSGENAMPFVYTDQEGKLSFTVPANWKEEDSSGDRDGLDAQFVSTEKVGLIMMYGSNDLWSELTYAEKIGHTREDVNNSLFSEEKVAQIYLVTPDKVSTVYYSGREYYKCEVTKTVETMGAEITVKTTILTHFDNGWMYVFVFGGTSDEALYSDFESLVKSAQYLAIPSGGYTPDKESSTPGSPNANKGNGRIVVMTVLVVAFLAGIIVVTIWVRRPKKYEDIDYDEALAAEERRFLSDSQWRCSCGRVHPKYESSCICGKSRFDIMNSAKTEDSSETTATGSQILFCRKCGEKLLPGSQFCRKCGTRVEEL